MYRTKSNQEIGKYLLELINDKFGSQRQFCVAYVMATENETQDEERIQRMANRISQITQGKKAVQLADFPIFTELLGVSCEEILSAGECSAPTVNHLTNYLVAFSRDEKLWEEYVHREDKLILKLDEYGKTVIDYALEFKNFGFLKFLMVNNYIWFVDVATDPKDYFRIYAAMNFGAGTSIAPSSQQDRDTIRWRISCPQNNSHFEGRYPCGADVLQTVLAGNDDLRMQIISLAIEYSEVDMLRQLRAREIPSLYRACNLAYISADCDSYYNENMVKYIATAEEEILDYFSEEFEIVDRFGRKNRFMFPFMSSLVELLIRDNSQYSEKMLRASIEHNGKVYKEIKKWKGDSTKYYQEYYEKISLDAGGVSYRSKEEIRSLVDNTVNDLLKQMNLFENGNIVCYRDGGNKTGGVTNIVYINAKSNKSKIDSLIQEVNDWYERIRSKRF